MAIDRNVLVRVLESARGKLLTVEEILERAGLDQGSKPHLRRELRALADDGRIVLDGRRFRALDPQAAKPKESEVVGRGKRRPDAPHAAEEFFEPSPIPPSRPQFPPPRAPTKAPERAEKQPIRGPRTAPPPVLPKPPKPESGLIVGTLTKHRDGYGFIAPIHGGEDFFVPPQAMGDALDGDVVQARQAAGRDGRTIAKDLVVVERRRQYAVGVYRTDRGPRPTAHLEPRDTALGPTLPLTPDPTVADGEVVRVRLIGGIGREISGEVVSRVGLPGDPNVEVLSVAYSEGFSDVFPADTLQAAEETPDRVRPEDKQGRRDLTGLDLVTIDGEDARDFDDAVYIERTRGGWRLVVAIADVTHYVSPGGALDREALRRATSVYFPRHVLPMLPERLSNGICSLNPKVERLCMVADMALDRAGKPIDSEIYPAVMLSRARCTYTQVASLIEGKSVPELAHVSEMLALASELATTLTKARMGRGAIDFDIPEGQIVLDAEGEISAIVKRPRNAAHRLVEEFMLAANEAVARYFESRSLPTVYRVHGAPKEERLKQFVELAGAFGHVIRLDQAGKVSAAELNAFLHRVEGKPEQRALNSLLLRSMMQAVYSADNIGHFGLAAESYLHFTSPIRRYPDLIVHRLLKEHWARGGRVLPERERARQAEELESLAAHCSERERASTSAEREIDAFYAASLLKRHVGERFKGTIASVAEFGLFIEIDDPFVQGLVRAETLGENWKLDLEKHRLVFGKSRSYGVGESCEVEVASADPVLRRIDLRLIEGGKVLNFGEFSGEGARPRFLADAIADAKKRGGQWGGGGRGGGSGAPRGKPGGKPGERGGGERGGRGGGDRNERGGRPGGAPKSGGGKPKGKGGGGRRR